MKYAVQFNNQFNGVVYDFINTEINAHHAQYNETLVPVLSLTNLGTRIQPNWQAELPTTEQQRAAMIVTMRQARLALHQAGLLSSVDSAMTVLPEADSAVAQIEWEYATEVQRDYPWVIALGAQLGLTDAQIDELFTVARTL